MLSELSVVPLPQSAVRLSGSESLIGRIDHTGELTPMVTAPQIGTDGTGIDTALGAGMDRGASLRSLDRLSLTIWAR